MISFIVPIYNAEKFLAACIESLLAQTVNAVELILVDDESTDGSLAMAQTYAAKDPRVHVFPQTHAGQSVARNLGMKQAKGEYIAFVDADDQLEPDWCERHLAVIEGVDYVQSGYKRGSQKIPLTDHQFTSPCMRLYRKEAIEHLSFAEGYIYEDVLFSVDLWLTNATCRRIPYSGYIYTLNPDGTTSRPHPEAQRKVLMSLREKARKASLKGKIIILYTIIRLKLHFILR